MPPLFAVLISKKSLDQKYEFVKVLINKGTDLNCLDEWGESPLHYWIRCRYEEHIRYFDILNLLRYHRALFVRGRTSNFISNLYDEELDDPV